MQRCAMTKMILFENVPAITTKKVAKGSSELIVSLIKKELADAGYKNMKEFVLNAIQYGVPHETQIDSLSLPRKRRTMFLPRHHL